MGAFVRPALADWWIVRSADGGCLVVDIQPTGKDPTVTKVGKDSYQTEAEANADLKRLCEEPKAPTARNREGCANQANWGGGW